MAEQSFPPPGGAAGEPEFSPPPGDGVPASGADAPHPDRAGGAGGTWLRPGIIPLRPLDVGDIIDGAARAVRFNPAVMLGMSFVVNLVAVAIGLGLLLLWERTVSDSTVLVRLDPSTITSLLATVVLTGLVTQVVGEAVMGRKATIPATWRMVKDRLLPLLGYQVLVVVAVLALALTVVGLLALPLMVYLVMVPAAIVLERVSIPAAVRRSIALVRGAFWRTLGILLLIGVIILVIGIVLTVPLSLLGGLLLAVASDGEVSNTSIVLLSAVTSLISGTLLQPFASAAGALLYVDRRMRVEGLDVTLARYAQGPGR